MTRFSKQISLALVAVLAYPTLGVPVFAQQPEQNNGSASASVADPDPIFIQAQRYSVLAEQSWKSCNYGDATLWANRSLTVARSIPSANIQQAYDAKAVETHAESLLHGYATREIEMRKANEDARREVSKHHLFTADTLLRVHDVPQCDPGAALLRRQIAIGMANARDLVSKATHYPNYQYSEALPLLQEAGRVQVDYPNLSTVMMPYRESRSADTRAHVGKAVKVVLILGAIGAGGWFGYREYQIHSH